MTFNVIAEAEAKREWNEAVDWYEEREAGVGWRFDDELQVFLQILAQDPEQFGLATKLTRKAKMHEPWPYSITSASTRNTVKSKFLPSGMARGIRRNCGGG